MTKSWAAEYGPHGVRVNAVSPGPTFTEGTAGMKDALSQLAAPAPAGRPAAVDEIAEAIVFLASQRASFIHGAILPVDGGPAAICQPLTATTTPTNRRVASVCPTPHKSSSSLPRIPNATTKMTAAAALCDTATGRQRRPA